MVQTRTSPRPLSKLVKLDSDEEDGKEYERIVKRKKPGKGYRNLKKWKEDLRILPPTESTQNNCIMDTKGEGDEWLIRANQMSFCEE